jgi:hypothetical protein
LLRVSQFVLRVSQFVQRTTQCYARRCKVGLNSLKSLNLTNVYPNNNKNKNKNKKNNKVKSKPLELFELAGKTFIKFCCFCRVLRYEDFAANPRKEILELTEYFGLQFTKEIESYVSKKLDNNGNLLTHSADTSSNSWQSQMPFESISQIQDVCSEPMVNWGYKLFTYEDVHPNRAVLPLDLQPKIVTRKPKNLDIDPTQIAGFEDYK